MATETILEAQNSIQRLFSTPFVDDELCQKQLGRRSDEIDAARLYLQIPISARPLLSYFFDKHYYVATNPDVAAAGVDPFIHFLKYGCTESRSPHPLVNFAHMRSCDRLLFSDAPSLFQLEEALFLDLVDPSAYFSLAYYKSQVTGLEASQRGLLGHFLAVGLLSGLRPNPFFDPLWYYRHLDGAQDVWSGLRHFVISGDREGQAPSARFSGRLYLQRNSDVVAAGTPPLAHYLTKGIHEGRACFAVQELSISRANSIATDNGVSGAIAASESVAIYRTVKEGVATRRQRAKDAVAAAPLEALDIQDPLKHITSLALPRFAHPRVSILIPAYNEAKCTVECIGSILASPPKVSYEVVIADDASPDTAAQALKRIKNVKFVRQRTNLGFLKNCNATFRHCKGEYLFLLNNDAQLRSGALDALVDVLDRNPDVAAVGPKLLYPNGRLQEAGCAINRDGVSTMVGLFSDPSDPGFNHNREVQYCSGAALLVRSSELDENLFDERFAPAYCEDADLCLRLKSKGRRIIYCCEAEVIHHLSVSTNKHSVTKRMQLVVRNQQKLSEKWSSLLEQLNKVRPIAFYLPQYHPTAANDFYWGQGFTEWTNVAKATPAYGGHYQPHLPADLGFYDLRVKKTMERQASLARRYGISGFCVYYYNFGRRALDEAFEALVADRSIDFPYCVCWANENWTRHWDGGSRELIFEQKYDESTLMAVIQDAVRYAADPRYIQVNGKPLFLIYRALLLPDAIHFTSLCRSMFREAGFDDVYLVYVESMEAAELRPKPSNLGFDACVEFPPQGLAVPATDSGEQILREGFVGVRYDYEATVLESIGRPSVSYKRHACVFPSWDNTSRQPIRGDSFVRATPEAFQVYVEQKLEEVIQQFVGDERLLFVNAWNEWAEGTHLEPDQRFGHRWLEAIRDAMLAKSLA
jgi:O-antigen biosynthesis protein